jgi:hypothetical protein
LSVKPLFSLGCEASLTKIINPLRSFYVLLIQKLRLKQSNVVRGEYAAAESDYKYCDVGDVGSVCIGHRISHAGIRRAGWREWRDNGEA